MQWSMMGPGRFVVVWKMREEKLGLKKGNRSTIKIHLYLDQFGAKNNNEVCLKLLLN